MMFCTREILPLGGSEKPFVGKKQQASLLLHFDAFGLTGHEEITARS